jgi:ubiquinone/menaquinone biosynthesis C-methylase UbiE
MLHAAWHLLYGRMAWLFDFVAHRVSGGKWEAWGRSSLPYLQGERVLELAHGPGHLLLALAGAGYRPVGIDRSSQMGRQAARRLRRAGVRVPLVRCEAQALPFRAGVFDEVVATFPTDYIFDARTLEEAARVTAARGRLVVVVGAQPEGPEPDRPFIAWLSTILAPDGSAADGGESVFERAGLQARIELAAVGEGMAVLVVAEKVEDLAAIAGEIDRDLRAVPRPADTVHTGTGPRGR